MSRLSCWIGFIVLGIAACFTAPTAVWGEQQPQDSKDGSIRDSEVLRPGVVVEEVARNSAADQAGIRAGDVLLSWSRGDAKGPIESPFDLSHIEIEQGQPGAVTLAGLRGDEKRTWEVAPDAWGLKTRPNLQSLLLTSYLEGQQLANAGKVAQAVERWRVAEQELHTSWLRSWFLFHGAEFLAEAKQSQEADRAYQEAVDIEAEGEPIVAEQMLHLWGKSLFQQNDTEGAEKRYREALAQSRRLGDESLTTAADLYELGLVFRGRQDVENEQQYLTQSLVLRERLAPGSLVVADTLQIVGAVNIERGALSEGEADLLRALAIAEHLAPKTERVATGLWRLGIIAGQRFAFAEAERYVRRSITLEERLSPESTSFGAMLGGLGNILFLRGDLAQAEEYYLRQLVIAEKIAPGTPRVAAPLNNLGNVAFERGDLVKAEGYYRQSLAIHVKTDRGGLRIANNLNSLGDVFLARGDFAEAAKSYGQALAIRMRQASGGLDEAESMHSLADAERAMGDLGKAEEHYREALEIRRKLAPGSALEADTLAALGLIMQTKQQPDAAGRLFEQALSALENQYARLGGSQDTRFGYRAKFDSYYRNYVDLLVQQNQPELAFHVLERSRARSLLETLVEAHVDIHQGVDPKLLERERTLQSELAGKISRRISVLAGKHTDDQVAAVTKEIEDVVARYDEVEGQIRSTSPGYAALTQPQPLSAKEIQQQLLDRDTLLLEYSLGEERSHLFVVSSRSLKVFELPKRAVIERQAQHVYELLTERNRRDKNETYAARAASIVKAEAKYPGAISQLSKTILGPVTGQLARKRLLMVGDGALYYVPFAALAADHEIVTLPSASVLAVLRRERMSRKPGTKMIAVLADPVFDRGDIRVKADATSNQLAGTSGTRDAKDTPGEPGEAELSSSLTDLVRSAADFGLDQERGGEVYLPRLQFSRQEANEITAAAPAGQRFKALDFKASRATAVSPDLANYRIVHFATHAMVNNAHPELSGLVLSLVDEQGRPQNGFLDLEDIYNLYLPAELVVLSACQTGLGKKVEGEGLVGLTRGFMYAGANRVVASLWKIDDRATAEFMRHFYIALLGHKMRPAAALRAAQLEMRNDKRWSSPYYWAAFQIQGEWK